MVLCGNNCTLYPTLHVMGFQSSSSILSDVVRTCLIQIIMKDYITFPILLSNKNFKEKYVWCVVGGNVFKGVYDARLETRLKARRTENAQMRYLLGDTPAMRTYQRQRRKHLKCFIRFSRFGR
ncbi:hypothetical protein HYC85_029417 [Camellia sinensis]|uniref:Uncharacterized protein n=1 Tax=Camellia sinensis TaxID=4442 RepID=A0A7J7G1Y7_CAMSI|nr:hypothetical protein HYC85_029417 [Camellia sinensis]